jgi:tetratricopeptide (TPR) repeat protein
MFKQILQASLITFLVSLPSYATDSAKDLLQAGRVDDAITALNSQIAAKPGDPEAIHQLCRAYFQYEDWDRAEPRCKKAVEMQPNNSGYHRWLGRIYGEKASRANILSAAGLAGKTRDEFKRAAELDPRDKNAAIDVAEYYLEAPGFMGGGQDKAREQARIIGKVNPAQEHWVYARIAEKNKDFVAAEREYRLMVDLSKGDAEAWLNLGFFYRNRNRYEEMAQAFMKMNQASMPAREVLFEAANSLFHTGRELSLAIELLKRYFADGPVEEAPAFKAHYLLGQLLEKKGDQSAAAAEYRAALALAHNYQPAREALRRIAP